MSKHAFGWLEIIQGAEEILPDYKSPGMNSVRKIVSQRAILSALAEYMGDSDLVTDLFQNLEKRMMYGVHFHRSMSAEEIALSLDKLLENYPQLINFERFQGISEENWGEAAWGEICWNL